MVQLLLGVDIGTTACKALALEASGQVVALAERPTPWVEVETGGEIRAEVLEEAVITAITDALSQAPEATVSGVGVTGMGETGFLVDRHGQALTPGIAWHDRRGFDEAEALAGRLGPARFQERTGLPAGPGWTIAKIRSLLEDGPPPGAIWLSIAEWAAHRFGGEPAAEPSLASRTGFFDVLAGRWWAEAAEAVGLGPEHLPRIVPAGTATGSVSGLGRLAGAVVTIAGHDQPVGAVGAGALAPAEVHVSCGTAEAVLQSLPRPLVAATTSAAAALGLTAGCHALTDRYALMGFITSGLALRSVLRQLGVAEAGHDRDRLDNSAMQAMERTEVGFDGLHRREFASDRTGTATSSDAIWAAALEASAREGASLLRSVEAVGGPAERVVLSGGWTRSDLFLAIRRRFVPSFDHVLVGETAARGAALFAGMAAGVYADHRDFPPPALSEP
jgi:sugar (pentulose or hexulose) kinase